MKIEEIKIGEDYLTRCREGFDLYKYKTVRVVQVIPDEFCVLVSWADGQKTWLYPENLIGQEG